MADRVMRASRLGAVSYETDRNHDLAPRQIARYRSYRPGSRTSTTTGTSDWKIRSDDSEDLL